MGVNMGVLSGVIGGAIDFASGMFQSNKSAQLQKQFAQQGIQWRVKDAIAAGVHPLFALGGSTQGFTPSPAVPTNMGAALTASETQQEAELRKAQMLALSAAADKDFAEASLFRSEEARHRQTAAATSPFPEMSTDQVDYQDSFKQSRGFRDDMQVYNPYSDAIVRRASPELFHEPVGIELPARAGMSNLVPHDGWSQFEFGGGAVATFRTAPDQLLESIGELGPVAIEAMLAENYKRFGKEGLQRAMDLVSFAKDSRKAGKEYGRQFGYGQQGNPYGGSRAAPKQTYPRARGGYFVYD